MSGTGTPGTAVDALVGSFLLPAAEALGAVAGAAIIIAVGVKMGPRLFHFGERMKEVGEPKSDKPESRGWGDAWATEGRYQTIGQNEYMGHGFPNMPAGGDYRESSLPSETLAQYQGWREVKE